MKQQQLLPLLNDGNLADRVKLEDLLQVALGVRGCSQLLLPAELPDGGELVEEVDRSFSQKYFYSVNPNAGMVSGLVDRVKYVLFRAAMNPIQYKAALIRETLDELLVESESYQAHKQWVRELGLDIYETRLRPSINELFVYSAGQLAEIQKLVQLRNELREDRQQRELGVQEMTAVVFPEQHSAEYVTGLGRLLGYPDCCIESYLADRQAGIVPEVRGAEQLAELKQKGAQISNTGYFARDFVPCHPDCDQARVIGEKVLERFAEADPQRLVPRCKGVFEANRKHLSSYPELVEKHRQRLEGELEQIHKRESDQL